MNNKTDNNYIDSNDNNNNNCFNSIKLNTEYQENLTTLNGVYSLDQNIVKSKYRLNSKLNKIGIYIILALLLLNFLLNFYLM